MPNKITIDGTEYYLQAIPNEPKVDYEILSFKSCYMGENDVLFNKNEDGYYHVKYGQPMMHSCWTVTQLSKEPTTKIHSVKRLSDGEVFELHKTKVVDPNTKHEWVISEITLNKGSVYFNGVWINHVQIVKPTLEKSLGVTIEEYFYIIKPDWEEGVKRLNDIIKAKLNG